MDNLGELLASVAGVFEKREEQLLKKMSLLERRIGELEQKLERYETDLQAGLPVVAPVVEEKVQETVQETVQEEQVSGIGLADETVIEERMEEISVPQEEIEIELEFEFDDDEADGDVVEDVEEVEVVQEAEPEQESATISVMEKAKPDWYDWEVDIPGPYLEDIWDGIGLNDRMLFLNELFSGNDDAFRETLEALNGMGNLVEATAYVRGRFPEWNEESDEVYRFYMTVRRRFVKQKQEEF